MSMNEEVVQHEELEQGPSRAEKIRRADHDIAKEIEERFSRS